VNLEPGAGVRGKESFPSNLLWPLIVLGVGASALVFEPSAKDGFRFPKELVARALIVLVISVLASAWIVRGYRAMNFGSLRSIRILLAAIATWTIATTMMSTNPLLSVGALLWVLGMIVIFLTTVVMTRSRGSEAVLLVLLPAVIVVAQIAFQVTHQNFFINLMLQNRPIGFQGNPNDAAGFLLAPGLAAAAGAIAFRSSRVVFGLSAILIWLAVLVTQSITGVASLLTGLFIVALLLMSRRGLLVFLVVLALTAAGSFWAPFSLPIRQRVSMLVRSARAGNLEGASSGRFWLTLVTHEMIRENFWSGVGPGCFAWNYYPYLVQTETRLAHLLARVSTPRPEHSRQAEHAHNEHLQIMAETGVPGYILFVVVLIGLARLSLRRRKPASAVVEERAAFSRLLALPLASAMFLFCLTQFPLRLADTTLVWVYFSGLCFSWRDAS